MQPDRNKAVLVVLCLTSLIWIVFGQTLGHGFVEYDDPNYVYQNPIVSEGITLHGLSAAFTQPHARNWHPLTTISHMLDCQFFGLNPAGHHLTSVLLHTVAAVLLFFFLHRVTSRIWLSAFVATVFAIHPLRVESVAWVSERKDVLSAVFLMITLHAYARYAAAPTRRRYLWVICSFALGLMSKPMLVTTPFLLLLLDYWPMGRFRVSHLSRAPCWRRLLLEKIPLLLLSLLTGIATLIAQRSTIGYAERVPFLWRISNAAESCVVYVWQLFWPLRLAAFYPQAEHGILGIALSFFVLISLTLGAVLLRRTYPYMFVGWLWYLISLLPVLGLIPVGLQAHADRYTYLPEIGLCLALTWLIADITSHSLSARRLAQLLAPTAVALLTFLASVQAGTWRNTETLWQHAAAAVPGNDLAHYNLALVAFQRGQVDEAISQYREALASSPDRETPSHLSTALLHNNLGNVLLWKGLNDEAAAHYREAIELRPDFADAYTNLANLLLREGQTKVALEYYRRAYRIPPEDAKSHRQLAVVLEHFGETQEAAEEYRSAVELTNSAAAKGTSQAKPNESLSYAHK